MLRKMQQSNLGYCWVLSCLISAAAIYLIGYKWFQAQRVHGIETNVVRNESELEKVLKARDTIEFQGRQKPYCIPTGFFIQSLAFRTPSDVNITGYIWQKYPEDFPKEIKRGFIFPEEVDSGNTKLEVIYQYTGKQDGKTYDMIGWYFDVTVRQSFDYSNYPLDFLTVWLRLWQVDSFKHSNVMLTPDFKAYGKTGRKTFGLDIDIVQGEWEIDETFFSYENIPYDTDFGFFTNIKENHYKEFFINLGIRRKFIDDRFY